MPTIMQSKATTMHLSAKTISSQPSKQSRSMYMTKVIVAAKLKLLQTESRRQVSEQAQAVFHKMCQSLLRQVDQPI